MRNLINLGRQVARRFGRVTTTRTLVCSGALFTTAGLGALYNGILPWHEEQQFPLKSTTPLAQVRPPQYGDERALNNAINEIRAILGPDRVVDLKGETYLQDNGMYHKRATLEQCGRYIISARSTEEVSKIMQIAYRYAIPIVPFGGGTSLEGHVYSNRGGFLLDTSRMKRILQVNSGDLDCTVEAGVGWRQLNEHLAKTPGLDHLTFGCECGPHACFCGMVATNASGIAATRYGSMQMNVISITAVLADGTVIKTKRRPRKSSAGYNLTGLLIGSEGTLAVVTEVVLRLQIKSAYESVAVVQFPELHCCTDSVSAMFKAGIPLNAVELLDSKMMNCINESGFITKKAYKPHPTLFLKIGGFSPELVQSYLKEIKRICESNRSIEFQAANDPKDASELFSARRNALYIGQDYANSVLADGTKFWLTDIAVPLSKLSPTLVEIEHLFKQYPTFEFATIGHVGDGNFHHFIFYQPEENDKVEELVGKMIDIGLKYEGTCTGEHGVGLGKREYLEKELSPDTVDLMRKLKFALDPKRILNPDKVIRVDPLDTY